MSRREYGAGSIERRFRAGQERFRARIRLASGKRQNLGEFDTEVEAAGVLAAAAEELEQAGLAAHVGLSLAAYGRHWLAERERAGVRNIDMDRSRWRNHIAAERFAQIPLNELTPLHIRDWVRDLANRRVTIASRKKTGVETRKGNSTLSRQTIKHAINLVRCCLDEAVIEDHLVSNPAKNATAPKKPRMDESWTYLQPDEIDKLLSCEAIPELKRMLFQLAIYSGLREGELWGLRWADVHLDCAQPKVVVRFSYNGPTKSGKPRELLLFPPAAAALRRLRELQSKPHRLVFPAASGGCHYNGYDAGWADTKTKDGVRPGCKARAGITRRIRFHDLRHTCASHLMSGTWGRDWRLEEVKEYLGHTSITATQRYAHLSPKAMRAAVAGTACSELQATSIKGLQRAEIDQPPATPSAASVAIIQRHQHGPTMAPAIAHAANAKAKPSTISPAHPGAIRTTDLWLRSTWSF